MTSQITSLKMRTQFQAQPKKAREISVAHKDCVICSGASQRLRVAKCTTGGAAAVGSLNMSMLMPSSSWPTDHLAVLCVVDVLLQPATPKSRSTTPTGEPNAAVDQAKLAEAGLLQVPLRVESIEDDTLPEWSHRGGRHDEGAPQDVLRPRLLARGAKGARYGV